MQLRRKPRGRACKGLPAGLGRRNRALKFAPGVLPPEPAPLRPERKRRPGPEHLCRRAASVFLGLLARRRKSSLLDAEAENAFPRAGGPKNTPAAALGHR